jgi:tetratricopeptide (TPR) repeat protein
MKKQKKARRPFWLPASSFYFLISGFAVASFFLVIGIAHDDGSQPEIVFAGLVASGVLISGVILREVVLRNAREKYLIERNRLDKNIESVVHLKPQAPSGKFTLEKNAAALESIKRRSEAANLFDRIAQGHRDVFEMCAEYRRIVASEMRTIHPDSPRLKALIKGNDFALKTHKFHLLRWAELESKSLTALSRRAVDVAGRIELTEQAKEPLSLALRNYPDEPALVESLELLDELVVTTKVGEMIERAENSAKLDQADEAVRIYRAALDVLEDHRTTPSYELLRKRIEEAIKLIGNR